MGIFRRIKFKLKSKKLAMTNEVAAMGKGKRAKK